MDFGEVLERWEKSRQPPRKAERRPRVDMGAALERYPPAEGLKSEGPPVEPSTSLRALRDIDPQAELDLHGLSAPEAEGAIEAFVRDARARGLVKVLLIHGKGQHSHGEPVLERVVRNFLEKCPHTGAFGKADRAHGGRGATWVRIRQRG
jgi:DNA-nicking Smr family endonuclease